MWRVILVDDEEYVRSYLISLFPWKEFGFELPLEAEDGLQAIALIQSTHPDLIFTDIRMPEKDGLELTAWVREHAPDSFVIVLSAYNDFSFVREALRLGAKEYLMKTEASVKTASHLLQRMSELLKQRDFAKLQELQNHNTAEYYRKQAVTAFWRDFLTGIIHQDELLLDRAVELNISLKETYFALILAHIKNHDVPDWEAFFQTSLTSVFPEDIEYWLLRFLGGNWVILIAKPVTWTHEGVLKLVEDVARKIADSASGGLTLCNSPNFYQYSELPDAYHLVQEINLLRVYKVEDNYISYRQFIACSQAPLPLMKDLLNEWERSLRGKNFEGIQKLLKQFFDQAILDNLAPSKTRMLVMDLIVVLRKIVLERRLHWEQISKRYLDPIENLERLETYDDWCEWLLQLAENYCALAEICEESPAAPIIRKALDFIQTNLERDISLGEVAENIGVSKYHLSRIFPQYVGEHFGDYIQRLKLEKAKELLRLTNMRIYQVAEKVGFYNIRYFSRVFRDSIGVTPADYRRMNQ